jgi:hypothetical protein
MEQVSRMEAAIYLLEHPCNKITPPIKTAVLKMAQAQEVVITPHRVPVVRVENHHRLNRSLLMTGSGCF